MGCVLDICQITQQSCPFALSKQRINNIIVCSCCYQLDNEQATFGVMAYIAKE